jgi:hypothetical protein
MKPKDFYKIMQEFVDEDRRWRALKVGDTIYDEQPGGMEDYHKIIIDEINLEEREVIAHDASPIIKFHNVKLEYFLTEFEFFKKQFK